MNISKNGVRALVAAGAIAMGLTPVLAATNGAASVWNNCTSVHTRYPHGVGKLRAHDRTRLRAVLICCFRYAVAWPVQKGAFGASAIRCFDPLRRTTCRSWSASSPMSVAEAMTR